MRRTRQLARGLALVAALGVAACSDGGGDGGGSPGGFTNAMVSGLALYRDVQGAAPERGVTSFAAAGTFTDRRETPAVATEESGTWSIDTSGKLVLVSGGSTTEVTLVAEAATYLDVTESEGGSSRSLRLHKLTAIPTQDLVGRHAVEGRELGGLAGWAGVIRVEAGGTAVFADGIEDAELTWETVAGGVVRLAAAGEVNDLRRVASSSGLRVVGEVSVGGAFDHLVDATLTPTAATGGFTAAMVQGRTFYWEDQAFLARTLLSLAAGGAATEWYEQDWFPEEQALAWSVGAAGSLFLRGPPGWNQGLLLLEETATDFDVLWYDEFVGALDRERLVKTVPVVEAEMLGTWTVTGTDLDGLPYDLGTATLEAGGAGTSSTGGALAWQIDADGALLLSIPSLGENRWMNRLAGSTASAPEFGVVADTGVEFWTEYLTLTR